MSGKTKDDRLKEALRANLQCRKQKGRATRKIQAKGVEPKSRTAESKAEEPGS